MRPDPSCCRSRRRHSRRQPARARSRTGRNSRRRRGIITTSLRGRGVRRAHTMTNAARLGCRSPWGWTATPRCDQTGEGEYEGNIVEHWWTPRGPLGGYVMAIVHRGMELAVDDPSAGAPLAQRLLPAPAARRPDHRATGRRAGGPLAHDGDRAARAGRQADRARRGRVLCALAGARVPVGGADAGGRATGASAAASSRGLLGRSRRRRSWAGSRCSGDSAIPPSANRSTR